MFKKTVLFLMASLFCLSLSAQSIKGKLKKSNPTIFIQTSGLDGELTKYLQYNFKYSGWFKPSADKNADFAVSFTKKDAKNITIKLVKRDGSSTSWNQATGSLTGRNLAVRLVDKIAALIFKNTRGVVNFKGICASRIAFSATRNGKKEIYSINVDGTELTRRTYYSSITVEPAWSPDGRQMTYTVYGKFSTSLVMQDVALKRHRRVSSFSGMNSSSDYRPINPKKPTDQWIALSLSKDGNVGIYVIRANVKNPKPTRITPLDGTINSSSSWAPNGRQICYVSASPRNGKIGKPQLKIIDIFTKKVFRLFKDGVERTAPDWSKTSSKICYTIKDGGKYKLAVCNPANPSASERIIDVGLSGDLESPSWAPDGRHVVCVRNISGKKSLYIIDTWYKTARHLNLPFSDCSTPSWSPLM